MRSAATSEQEGAAKERGLQSLAAIPQLAIGTAERVQRMRTVSLQSQMRFEALEQKRLEIERRIQEGHSLYSLRMAQSQASAAHSQAEAAKLELARGKLQFDRERFATTEDRRSAEIMDDSFWDPYLDPQTQRVAWRTDMKGGVRLGSMEETAEFKAQKDREARLKESQIERNLRPPQARSSETAELRRGRISNSIRNLTAAIESLDASASKAERASPEYAADRASMEELVGRLKQRLKATFDEPLENGAVAPAPEAGGNPFASYGMTDAEYAAALKKHGTREKVAEILKKAGVIK